MIADFLASWELFQNTYLASWAIAVGLSLVGVWVVARNQIFLGIAVSQASVLGIALALWIGGSAAASRFEWLHGDGLATGLAIGAAVATALLTGRGRDRGTESPEAVMGWVFLAAASLPVLLLSRSAHGLEEIHRLAFSTLLGASGADLIRVGSVAAATVLLALHFRDRLLLLALDPETAVALGVRHSLVLPAVSLWLGLCVGLSMRVSGMLYTFGCLVLPALVAKNLSREIRPLLWRAPAVALGAAVPGVVLAHELDTPPAHTTVALLCLALLLAWGVRRLRESSG